ncbi:MAG: transcriptional regulator NrdR [Nitrospirota bacterium]|nr:transcriptional regulator NrdR [Nitrospirota bacterium]
MKCPFCSYPEDRVVDSRTSQEGSAIRRRRECLQCNKRFTTYERVEPAVQLVVKKDGSREPYDRPKLLGGMRRACEKRPVSLEQLEAETDRIEQALLEQGESEVPSERIGELVMEALYRLDQVAYVRFASVYREFKDVNAFMDEIKTLLRTGAPAGDRG